MPGTLPLPRVQSFVICRAIYEDHRTRECLLIGPFGGIGLSFFPAGFRFSLYADLDGGHGDYELAFELRDDELEAIAVWRWPEPIRHRNPLEPYHIVLHDVVLEFPRPGHYQLVLLANGADVAHHGLEVTYRPSAQNAAEQDERGEAR